MDNKRHLERLSGSIIYEKLEAKNMNEITNYDELSKDELITLLKARNKPEELEKRTTQRNSGNSNYEFERKIQMLKSEYPNLSNDAIKKLVFLKDNRRFIETEDGITVEKVEEK
jgi:hypothetical protein